MSINEPEQCIFKTKKKVDLSKHGHVFNILAKKLRYESKIKKFLEIQNFNKEIQNSKTVEQVETDMINNNCTDQAMEAKNTDISEIKIEEISTNGKTNIEKEDNFNDVEKEQHDVNTDISETKIEEISTNRKTNIEKEDNFNDVEKEQHDVNSEKEDVLQDSKEKTVVDENEFNEEKVHHSESVNSPLESEEKHNVDDEEIGKKQDDVSDHDIKGNSFINDIKQQNIMNPSEDYKNVCGNIDEIKEPGQLEPYIKVVSMDPSSDQFVKFSKYQPKDISQHMQQIKDIDTDSEKMFERCFNYIYNNDEELKENCIKAKHNSRKFRRLFENLYDLCIHYCSSEFKNAHVLPLLEAKIVDKSNAKDYFLLNYFILVYLYAVDEFKSQHQISPEIKNLIRKGVVETEDLLRNHDFQYRDLFSSIYKEGKRLYYNVSYINDFLQFE